MLAAMRRASSRVSRCAAERRPGSSSKHVGERLPVGVADDEASVRFLDGPGQREAALGHDPLVEIENEGAYVSSRVEGAQRGLIGRVMMEYALWSDSGQGTRSSGR